MPSPSTSSSTSNVTQSGSQVVNTLLGEEKWGGVPGTGATLTYSFPWTSAGTATFSGGNGSADYSTLNEQNASFHYGLNATQQAAARSALQEWAKVANITFSEVAENSSSVGDIRFAWTSASQLIGADGYAWGWASYPDSYWPSAGDVWISTMSSGATDRDWSVGSYNFMLLLHELGHALGLKHPFDGSIVLPAAQDTTQYTVMSYTEHPHNLFVDVSRNANGSASWRSFEVSVDSPMLYDVAATQYLYGLNLSYRTGNDVYTFDPATPFFRTLWDAGGTDTISVANFSQACVIDLRDGHFSSIKIPSDSTAGYNWSAPPPQATYDGTDNLAIAFGCVIENAIGGNGNDTLIGNSSDNSLDGGSGNDTLRGDAGNDTFDWDSDSRGGNDMFYGGAGNDIYVLNSASDSVIEYNGEGTDAVWVNFAYSIEKLAHVENLMAFGSTGVSLTGNAASNVLAGSSGNDILDGGGNNDVAAFVGKLADYTLTRSGSTCTVRSKTGSDGTDTVINIESLSFSDLSVNLTVQSKAAAAPQANVQRLIELYVAFFNRIADADGLGYWIDQMNAGQSINSIAETFYNTGKQYSSLTGFNSAMSNADFINVVYRNVLGRSEGADSGGLSYWSELLVSGKASHGSLVSSILDSAHSFKGNAAYGYVANLLDNKITAAKTFAVDWGLGYVSGDTSITQGMAIAAAVTSTSSSAALALVGISAADISLG